MSDTPTTPVDTSRLTGDELTAAVDSIFAAQSRFAPDEPTNAPGDPGQPTEGDPQEPTTTVGDLVDSQVPVPDAIPSDADLVIGGRVIPADQASQLLKVYDWVDGMDPNLAAGIAELATGQYILTPRDNPYVVQPPAGAAPVLPSPEPPADPLAGIDPNSVDPDVLKLFRAQQDRLDEMQSRLAETEQISGQTQAQYEAQQRDRAAAQAIDTFKTAHNLDDETDGLLIANIVRAAAPLADQNSSAYTNPLDLYTESLERVAWSTPQFRDGLIGVAARSLSDTQAATSTEIQAKAARAAAATAPSGSVPRSEPNPRAMTEEERRTAMLADMGDKFFRKPN